MSDSEDDTPFRMQTMGDFSASESSELTDGSDDEADVDIHVRAALEKVQRRREQGEERVADSDDDVDEERSRRDVEEEEQRRLREEEEEEERKRLEDKERKRLEDKERKRLEEEERKRLEEEERKRLEEEERKRLEEEERKRLEEEERKRLEEEERKRLEEEERKRLEEEERKRLEEEERKRLEEEERKRLEEEERKRLEEEERKRLEEEERKRLEEEERKRLEEEERKRLEEEERKRLEEEERKRLEEEAKERIRQEVRAKLEKERREREEEERKAAEAEAHDAFIRERLLSTSSGVVSASRLYPMRQTGNDCWVASVLLLVLLSPSRSVVEAVLGTRHKKFIEWCLVLRGCLPRQDGVVLNPSEARAMLVEIAKSRGVLTPNMNKRVAEVGDASSAAHELCEVLRVVPSMVEDHIVLRQLQVRDILNEPGCDIRMSEDGPWAEIELPSTTDKTGTPSESHDSPIVHIHSHGRTRVSLSDEFARVFGKSEVQSRRFVCDTLRLYSNHDNKLVGVDVTPSRVFVQASRDITTLVTLGLECMWSLLPTCYSGSDQLVEFSNKTNTCSRVTYMLHHDPPSRDIIGRLLIRYAELVDMVNGGGSLAATIRALMGDVVVAPHTDVVWKREELYRSRGHLFVDDDGREGGEDDVGDAVLGKTVTLRSHKRFFISQKGVDMMAMAVRMCASEVLEGKRSRLSPHFNISRKVTTRRFCGSSDLVLVSLSPIRLDGISDFMEVGGVQLMLVGACLGNSGSHAGHFTCIMRSSRPGVWLHMDTIAKTPEGFAVPVEVGKAMGMIASRAVLLSFIRIPSA